MLAKVLHLLVFLVEKLVTGCIESTQNTASIPGISHLLRHLFIDSLSEVFKPGGNGYINPRNGIQRAEGSPSKEGTLLVTVTSGIGHVTHPHPKGA